MSNFWAERLSTTQRSPGHQMAPVVPAAARGAWWAPQAPVAAIPPPPDYDPREGDALRDYRPSQSTLMKAKNLRHMSTCPECASGNYMKVGTVAGRPVERCYDCGYPVVQSASGNTLPSIQSGSGEVVQKARQVSGPVVVEGVTLAQGFQPQHVIGHV